MMTRQACLIGIRVPFLAMILTPLSACDLFSGLISNIETNTQSYALAWGTHPTGNENLYEQREDSNPASPRDDTIIEVTVWTSEPLDLGDEDADLEITAILTSWGNVRQEFPIALTRVEFTWPPGIAQGGLVTDPSSPSVPLYAYKYSGQFSRKCPECVGDYGQSQPAYWRLAARRATPEDVRIHGTYTIEIFPYLGPIVN